MERVERIMKHPLYRQCQQRIEELEKDRIFCRHDRSHSLDVARIMYILILEQGLDVAKDVVYAAALLHDIGRAAQYDEHRPHHEAGAEYAAAILKECGYGDEDISVIAEAIAFHHIGQLSDDVEEFSFCKLLYEADKLCRNCFDCTARSECYWETDRQNQRIIY